MDRSRRKPVFCLNKWYIVRQKKDCKSILINEEKDDGKSNDYTGDT